MKLETKYREAYNIILEVFFTLRYTTIKALHF